jgi:lipid-binding SYLF domain-containing protein
MNFRPAMFVPQANSISEVSEPVTPPGVVKVGQTPKGETQKQMKGKVMQKKILNKALAALSVMAVLSAFSGRAEEDIKLQSQQAIADFQKADSSLKSFMDNAAGYAVFPSVGKGGLIVGGARGKGLLFEKGAVTGQTTMTQASIGAQAGGQTFAQIIVFESPGAVNDFKGGKFELSADVSAVAAAEGASKAANYKHGVAVFTLPKSGLMVQASVGGQKFKFEPLIPTGR